MNRLQANLCLLCVTICWSMEAIIFCCIPREVPLCATPCVTSITGALLLFAAFYRRAVEALKKDCRHLLLGCLGLAILSAAYNTLYLFGMKHFDVASGAFTFCMTVVVLPVVLLTMHRRIPLNTWISVLLVSVGIVLALRGTLHIRQLPGLGLMGAGCLLRAVFIVLLVDFSRKHDPLTIAIFLELFAGGYAFLGWLIDDPRLFWGLPLSRTLVASWAIYSYFVVAISQALNLFAVKRMTAANVTIVYSTEIVFTLIWGMFLPANVIEHINMTPGIMLGVILVILGNIAENIGNDERKSDPCEKERAP